MKPDELEKYKESLTRNPQIQADFRKYFEQLIDDLSSNENDPSLITEGTSLVSVCMQYGFPIEWILDIFNREGKTELLIKLTENYNSITEESISLVLATLDKIKITLNTN